MTDHETALRELLAKGSDATLLREMIGFAAQRLMELETETLTGSAHGERSPDRRAAETGFADQPREYYFRTPSRVDAGVFSYHPFPASA